MHFTYNKKTFRENLNLAKIPFSYKEEKKCPDYNLHANINKRGLLTKRILSFQ